MHHIAYQLPPYWAPIIEDIWIKNRPTDAVKFLNLLEEAERDIHPLWIKLENDPMPLEKNVREHINEKFETYKELKRKGFRPNMTILMYAIVETLPHT